MELKLQQAIVATRAGRTTVAQSLLTQLIREKPDDANAWFLLGHIVEEPERQVRYLQKTLELEPEHAIARRRLEQLQNGTIPPPLIPQSQNAIVQLTEDSAEAVTVQSPVEIVAETATVAELAEGLLDEEGTRLDTQNTADSSWVEAAGPPVRERKAAPAAGAAIAAPRSSSSAATTPTESTSDSTSGEVWLVRILVIMVIVAAIVLGILVLLILI